MDEVLLDNWQQKNNLFCWNKVLQIQDRSPLNLLERARFKSSTLLTKTIRNGHCLPSLCLPENLTALSTHSAISNVEKRIEKILYHRWRGYSWHWTFPNPTTSTADYQIIIFPATELKRKFEMHTWCDHYVPLPLPVCTSTEFKLSPGLLDCDVAICSMLGPVILEINWVWQIMAFSCKPAK